MADQGACFFLETERLVIRDWRGDEDWKAFFAHTNTPAVMRWLGGIYSENDFSLWRERVVAITQAWGHGFWLLERKQDGGHLSGEVLGFCGLKRADAPTSSVPGEFEIGWRLREDAWGRGYAKEAAIAAMDAAFDIFGAHEVYAMTIRENTPSWGLMERLGMERREDLDYEDARFDPPWCHAITYAMPRAKWKLAE